MVKGWGEERGKGGKDGGKGAEKGGEGENKQVGGRGDSTNRSSITVPCAC